jgi:hypothetical protein
MPRETNPHPLSQCDQAGREPAWLGLERMQLVWTVPPFHFPFHSLVGGTARKRANALQEGEGVYFPYIDLLPDLVDCVRVAVMRSGAVG